MIELIAAAVSGAVLGALAMAHVAARYRNTMVEFQMAASQWQILAKAGGEALTALRSNCFIPDERGVKVRYSQASVERRVKAETPKEVV